MDSGSTLELVSNLVAASAFLVLALWFLASWKRGRFGAWLLAACALSSLWFAAASYAAWSDSNLGPVLPVLETLRSVAWVAFMAGVLDAGRSQNGGAHIAWLVRGGVGAAGLLLIGLDLRQFVGIAGSETGDLLVITKSAIAGRLALAVTGLVIVENFYRNTAAERRWAIKYLSFGIAAIFAYDLFVYAEALLFNRVNPDLMVARGLTNAVIVPLIAVSAARNPQWSLDVFLSRRVVFHSTTLMGTGIYLIFVAAAGYYLREFGGTWGTVAQVTVFFAAVVLLAVVLFSGRFRANLSVMLNKHFFSYRYDYRDEWMRFIRTMTARDRSEILHSRVVQAIADVVESPDGGLWVRQNGGEFSLAREWNRRIDHDAVEPQNGPLVTLLESQGWVVNLSDRDDPESAGGDEPLPQWLQKMAWAWLVVPLVHRDRLEGFIVLGHSRAPRDLNWEDYDLLKILGTQVASYLAEQETEKALLEARQFEEFNRRFAFVLHDIKNLVSQLSLLASNADKHAENREFQRDMVDTVKESVEKMNRLLARLHLSREEDAVEVVDIGSLLLRLMEQFSGARPKPHLSLQAPNAAVTGAKDKMQAVLAHLVQNAIEAASEDGEVSVVQYPSGDQIVIEVIDSGEGMEEAFVRDHLFKPFRSTKKGGYGIGAYESRNLIQEMGGRLEVESRPGEGTTMRVLLPLVNDEAEHGRTVRLTGTV